MANNEDSYQIARNVVEQINSMKTMLRSTADSVNGMINNMESLLVDNTKKNILIDGLTALDIDIEGLKASKDTIKTVIDTIRKDIPELTKL